MKRQRFDPMVDEDAKVKKEKEKKEVDRKAEMAKTGREALAGIDMVGPLPSDSTSSSTRSA